MINFDFISPTKIFFGKKREEEIGKIINEYGYKKVLLHYGKESIKKIGLYDTIIKSLNDSKVDFIELGGVMPNPKISLVRYGVKLAKENNVDLILAVGGGSVIDSAKLIACGAKVDFDPWKFNSHEEVAKSAIDVGVILTISAAGSELSNSCVITNEQLNIKNGFNSDLIRPKFSIMNPELTYTVSKYQTACGIVDIMMHTMERYFSDVEGVSFSDEISLGLLKAVYDAGNDVMIDPYNYDARATLMIASSFSHNGLTSLGSRMYFTAHKIEHIISGLFDNVAHAAGLSVIFPAWAKYTSELFIDKWISFGQKVLNIDTNKKTNVLEIINKLEEYFKNLGMPTTLSELGLQDEIEKIADRATKGDTSLVPGVKKLNKEDVIKILQIAK